MEQLAGPLQEVFGDLKRKWQEFQDEEPFLHVLQGFVHAIDWTEPWIVATLAFHACLLLTALLTRKRMAVQGAVFAIAMSVVYFGERLNVLGGRHWARFSRQNYFDKSGIFMSAVVSGPLLLIMFAVLVNYLLACSDMLVQAKRKELIHKAKQRAKQARQEGGSAGAAGAGGEAKKTQ